MRIKKKSVDFVINQLHTMENKYAEEYSKVKPKPMKCRGEIITSEKQLFEMYEADMLTSSQYDHWLEKFDKMNEKANEKTEIYLEVVNIIHNLAFNLAMEKRETDGDYVDIAIPYAVSLDGLHD